jgi:four helix bundle protein
MMTYEDQLSHRRLDVYRVSIQLAVAADRLCRGLPPGNGRIKDQLRRASQAVPLLVAEGAHRSSWPQKRQRYSEARGEAGEVAAAAELTQALGLGDGSEVVELAARVAAMLTRLIRR